MQCRLPSALAHRCCAGNLERDERDSSGRRSRASDDLEKDKEKEKEKDKDRTRGKPRRAADTPSLSDDEDELFAIEKAEDSAVAIEVADIALDKIRAPERYKGLNVGECWHGACSRVR